jgi:ATP-dependent RNA helicase RhlE
MGIAPQIRQILQAVPEERQTLLYSATMPAEIVNIATNYMADPVRVEVARAGKAADDVTQELFVVPQDDKNELLAKLMYEYKGTILVFARTRSRAGRVARWLNRAGHNAAEIHSDRTLSQRRAALDGFKSGKYRILVATDIAARGIDVTGIELVLNYDLPDSPEDYVHRIGRTGRAGMSGHAISFAAPDQAGDVRDIEKLIQTAITVASGSEHQLEAIQSKGRAKRGRGGSRTPHGSGAGMRPRSNDRGGSEGRSAEGRSDAPRREGSASPEPRAPQGLHYSDATYQRSRPMTRGARTFSGRSSRKS